MHLDAGQAVLLAAAAFAAAGVNGVAGGGSLISFPTLLFLGVPPVAANVTNAVGLMTGYVSGSLAYRGQLTGQGRRLALLGAVSIVGSLAGALTLLHIRQVAFEAGVPWLILAACTLLAVQPLVRRAVERRGQGRSEATRPALLILTVIAAAYGAFFGAGLGVLTLAVLGLFLDDDLQRLNALKAALTLIINTVAAIVYLFLAPILWTDAAVMALPALAGGAAGVAAARRMHPQLLRLLVIAFGVAVAVRLLV
jgi:uncharacterized membrane protein YfcA